MERTRLIVWKTTWEWINVHSTLLSSPNCMDTYNWVCWFLDIYSINLTLDCCHSALPRTCSTVNRIYRQLLKVNWWVWMGVKSRTYFTLACVCVCEPAFVLCGHETARFQRPVERFKGLANEQVISLRLAWMARLILCVHNLSLCVTAAVGLSVWGVLG